uniref:Zona pellucida sperm-binding protein 3 n=1 Tax=Chelydra serpentina TaxID=8475 RepID=A0A8C3SQ09_CHESE
MSILNTTGPSTDPWRSCCLPLSTVKTDCFIPTLCFPSFKQQAHVPSIAQPYPWARVDVSLLRAVSLLHPVKVQCEEAQMVITVCRDLFGMAACWYTSLNAAENMVTFAAGLHECSSTLQTPDSLVYSTNLSYNPTPASHPVILRTSPAVIPIECHYHRKDNVSSKAIKLTWVPLSSTLSLEERLSFSLMNDDWSTERPFNGFQLGEVMHIQADVSTGNHVDLRLFVDSYVATLNPDRDSSPRYAVLDFNGCLVDGKSVDTPSAFISPRSREDTLQLMVDAFRFAGDASNLIYISCHLKVTAAEQAPDALNKACSFNKAGNIWSPVEGTRQICSCCETGNCGLVGGQSRRVNPLDRWSGRRFQRDVPPRHGKVSNVYILQTDIQVWLFRWGSIPNPVSKVLLVSFSSILHTGDSWGREDQADDVVIGPLFILNQGSKGLLEHRLEAPQGKASASCDMAEMPMASVLMALLSLHRCCRGAGHKGGPGFHGSSHSSGLVSVAVAVALAQGSATFQKWCAESSFIHSNLRFRVPVIHF